MAQNYSTKLTYLSCSRWGLSRISDSASELFEVKLAYNSFMSVGEVGVVGDSGGGDQVAFKESEGARLIVGPEVRLRVEPFALSSSLVGSLGLVR